MDAALSPIQEKLDKVTKLETLLRTVDPTIDIPDISDIKEAFDGAEDKIEGAHKTVLDVADSSITKMIPPMFRSREMLESRLLNPFLACVLFIQLVCVWFNERKRNAEVGDSSTEEPFSSQWEAEWEVISSAFLTYATTILQLVIAFVVSQLSVIVNKLNEFIEKIEGDINIVITEKVGGTFKFVFSEKMGGVREKTLRLIRDMEKIEGPLKKLDDLRNAKDMLSSLKEKEPDEILGDAMDAAANRIFKKFF